MVYRSRKSAFAIVRTTLVVMTALALVVYVVYPVAPPRLAIAGFVDTVSEHGPLDLSSKLLGRFYNPVAAVPSLHVGYALLVGAAIAWLAHPPVIRIAGALYPLVSLFVIVATGNHYYFDAVTGAAVTLAAALAARALTRDVDSNRNGHDRAPSRKSASHSPRRLASVRTRLPDQVRPRCRSTSAGRRSCRGDDRA